MAALDAPYTAPFTGGGEERRRPLPMVAAMAHMLLLWMRPSRSSLWTGAGEEGCEAGGRGD